MTENYYWYEVEYKVVTSHLSIKIVRYNNYKRMMAKTSTNDLALRLLSAISKCCFKR